MIIKRNDLFLFSHLQIGLIRVNSLCDMFLMIGLCGSKVQTY